MAADAAAGWAPVPAPDRGRAASESARCLAKAVDGLARLLAAETSKATPAECRPEIESAGNILAQFAGLGSELECESLFFSSHG